MRAMSGVPATSSCTSTLAPSSAPMDATVPASTLRMLASLGRAERDRDVARADAHAHRLADQRVEIRTRQRRRRRTPACAGPYSMSCCGDPRIDDRAAFEAARQRAAGPAGHHLRTGPAASDLPVGQHDRVREAHDLLDRVAHVDDRNPHFVAQALDVVQDLLLARRVERRERLVEQQQRAGSRAARGRWRRAASRRRTGRAGRRSSRSAEAQQVDDPRRARHSARRRGEAACRTAGCWRTVRCGNSRPSWNT